MRIACVYHPRIHAGCGKFHFIHAALQACGHDVLHVQTMDELRDADSCCDLILFEQRNPASLNRTELLEYAPHRQTVWMMWFFDLNLFDDSKTIGEQDTLAASLEIARVMDVVLVKERDRLAEYHDAGIPAKWFDQACPSNMRQAVLQDEPEFDVILWGSTSRPMWRQRWEDAESLVSHGFNVAWAADSGIVPKGVTRLVGCQPIEIPDLVERAKVTLVVDARQDIEGYWSDRIWLAAGAGACIVRRVCLGSSHLPGMGYLSHQMLVSAVRDFCDDFKSRQNYGEFARRMTMTWHCYERRVKELVHYAEAVYAGRHEAESLPRLFRQRPHQNQNSGRENETASMSVLH